MGIFGSGEFFHPILNVRLFDEIINSKLGIFVFGDFFPLYGLGLSLSHKVGIFSIFGRNFFPTLWQTTVFDHYQPIERLLLAFEDSGLAGSGQL